MDVFSLILGAFYDCPAVSHYNLAVHHYCPQLSSYSKLPTDNEVCFPTLLVYFMTASYYCLATVSQPFPSVPQLFPYSKLPTETLGCVFHPFGCISWLSCSHSLSAHSVLLLSPSHFSVSPSCFPILNYQTLGCVFYPFGCISLLSHYCLAVSDYCTMVSCCHFHLSPSVYQLSPFSLLLIMIAGMFPLILQAFHDCLMLSHYPLSINILLIYLISWSLYISTNG